MLNQSRNPDRVVSFAGQQLNLGTMSNALGISVSHLSRIFSGSRTPSLHVAQKIAEFLKISMDDLYRGLNSERV